MAIRSGSGGLKYALPSQAEIQARQNAAAASAGGSASASAYGANRRYAGLKRQLQYDAIQSDLDRRFRAESQLEGQRFRAEQSQLDRDFTAEQASERFQQQKALQQGAQSFDAQQAKLQRQFYTDRDAARFEQDQIAFEREQDAYIEQGLRTGELELTGKAERQLRQLEEDRSRVQGKDWSEEQREEFEQQYQDEKRRILSQAGPRRTPTATEQAQGVTTYFNPATGSFSDQMSPGMIPGQVRDGQFQPLVEQQEPDFEGQYGRIQGIMEEVVGTEQPFGTFDKAYAEDLRRQGVIAGQPGSHPGLATVPNVGGQQAGGQPAPIGPGHPGMATVPNVQQQQERFANLRDIGWDEPEASIRRYQRDPEGFEEFHRQNSLGSSEEIENALKALREAADASTAESNLPEGSDIIGDTAMLPDGRIVQQKKREVVRHGEGELPPGYTRGPDGRIVRSPRRYERERGRRSYARVGG